MKRFREFLRFFLLTVFLIQTTFIFSQPDTVNDPAIFLSQLIQKRSLTGNEGIAGRFLLNFCAEKGLYTRVFSSTDSTFNFCASLYPLSQRKPNIIFLSHLDVVSPGDTNNWAYPPFGGVIQDGIVWGRGAIDDKGLTVMQLFSVLNYIDSAKMHDLPYNVSVLFVSGEEGGNNNGSEFISNNFLDALNPVVIYGEGGSGLTDFLPSRPDLVVFGISVAEKRALWLRLTAYGQSMGHSAAPTELYANKRLLRALIRLLNEKKIVTYDKTTREMFHELGKVEGGVKGFFIRHINWSILSPFVRPYFKEGSALYSFVYSTFVITSINNPGAAYNEVSETASAVLDCRLLPDVQTSKYIKKIENIVGPRISIAVLLESPMASHSESDTRFFKAMAASLEETYPGQTKAIPVLFPASTDNNYYRSKGIPVYGILPCIFTQTLLETVHNFNERIPVSYLLSGIQAFSTCIGKLMSDEK